MGIAPESVVDRVAAVLKNIHGMRFHHDPPPDAGCAGTFVGHDGLPLPAELRKYVASAYKHGLFRHQHEALQHVLAGRNTVVATRTSSGKSLIFAVPAVSALIERPTASSLFLYPQKALANDQLQRLRVMSAELPSLAPLRSRNNHLVARYDGGTPDGDRKAIREQARIVLTNPDMLHWILRWHTKWQDFFANLRYVIVDECHEYSGIFGTNVAYALRRLRSVCRQYGSAPVFIATSATIHEPKAHLELLTGLPFEVIGPERDGSIQGRRKFWMLSGSEHYIEFSRNLAMSLRESGLTVLVFCPSRLIAERMLSRLSAERDLDRDDVRVYRAGLSGGERENIERGLREGQVRVVFATSALELGIDIGAIDAVICVGIPASMISLWQRAGRAARAGKDGAILLVPADVPIDAYFAEHPHELFNRDNEPLVLNLENRRVVCQHYACAVKEGGGDEDRLNTDIFGQPVEVVRTLRREGKLNQEIFYRDEPHAEVAIRGRGTSNYHLKVGDQDLGEIDEFHLLRESPRNAIYRHGGRTYRVKDVIPGKRIVKLDPERTFCDTVPVIQKKIRVKRRLRADAYEGLTVETDSVDVTEILVGLSERNRNGETVRSWQGSQGMPAHTLPTVGTRIHLSKEFWARHISEHGRAPAIAALGSIERLFCSLFPTVTGPCDPQDYSSATEEAQDGSASVYLYDNVFDGVDLTTAAFDHALALVRRAKDRIEACSCKVDEGCFRCIANPRANEPASKRVALAVLAAIEGSLEGEPTSRYQSDVTLSEELVEGNRVACKECGSLNGANAKFCSNCGGKLQ